MEWNNVLSFQNFTSYASELAVNLTATATATATEKACEVYNFAVEHCASSENCQTATTYLNDNPVLKTTLVAAPLFAGTYLAADALMDLSGKKPKITKDIILGGAGALISGIAYTYIALSQEATVYAIAAGAAVPLVKRAIWG